ncbi:MAG: excinuclease ABC subunit UvrC [Bradymonadales bacterium]|nr:excinuclease ABC subunit UvrC [Bradymonadales bacterium]
MDERFQKILDRTPSEPGVYLLKNQKKKLVYVGKAKNLKVRLRSYFDGTDSRPFVRRLSRLLGDVETIITRNEKEALLLENRLIKAHQPRFNIRLRDDKEYLWLRVDVRVDWPRVVVIRRPQQDGPLHFGPYHSASAIRQTLRILNRYFGLRTCSDAVLKNRSRPCLQYQIKRCPGPCVFPVDRAAYHQHVLEAVLFLQGKERELVDVLRTRMEGAAEQLDFELAAHYRDQIRDVERSLERQQIEGADPVDRDVIGLYRQGDSILVELLMIRQGAMADTRRLHYSDQDLPDEEFLPSLLLQYYDGEVEIPPEILVPIPVESVGPLGEILSERRQGKVSLACPQRGFCRALVATANRNAEQAFKEMVDATEHSEESLEKLQKRLHLPLVPRRIEGFDISNLGETAKVGSMVVFQNGEPERSSYRTFRIKSVAGQDDFASLVEVLTRRIKRSQRGLEPWPDLMVIDGGKGQLNGVVRAIDQLGAGHLEVVSLAKSRPEEAKEGGAGRDPGRTDERVFLPGIKDPIVLRPYTAELYLMQRIRDEAHRVALAYHQKLRKQRTLASVLDRIPGIGPQRRNALLKQFGSVGRIRRATPEQLADVEGISPTLALRIQQALGEED